MSERFDDAVVGAGILGLAHAYHLARRGRRVVVLDRCARAQGASVRNFGMLWPIGQPTGPRRDLALRSRATWLDVLRASGLWHERTGSLHVAYRDDEEQVLRELASRSAAEGFACDLLGPAEALALAPALVPDGLRAALWSPAEICVDPREVIAGLPPWLGSAHGVRFKLGRAVAGYDRPALRTSAGALEADRLWVCCGDDFETLYPEAFREVGIVRCKLQMLRSSPLADSWKLGPMLAAGLTLRHYAAFEGCPSLPALRARVARETPELDRYGIHVMAAQNGRGEVVLGDSHEYGAEIEPFGKARIDELILEYLATFVRIPGLHIASRWHGTYAKHPTEPYFVARPAAGAVVVTCAGGAGMTLSFGLAERVIGDVLEGSP